MNIFILDWDLEKCAQYHVNKHLVKMMVEYAQLLSTTNRLTELDEGYKIAYPNHPCRIWVGECLENWLFVRDLAREVNKELVYRGYAYHKSMDVINSLSIPNLPRNWAITRPWLAMPDVYKSLDTIQSYRNYYIGDKQNIADWGKRGIPYWYVRR